MMPGPPILPLDAWEPTGPGKLLTWVQVQSVMLYPEDPASREPFVATTYVKLALPLLTHENSAHAPDEAGALALSLVQTTILWTLLASPPENTVMEQASRASQRGMMAGDVLLHMIQLEAEGYGGSFNKAVQLLTHWYAHCTTPSGKLPPAAVRRSKRPGRLIGRWSPCGPSNDGQTE
jgi:hypothetical protein